MDILAALIVIIMPIVALIGLIKPSLLKQNSRAKAFFGSLGIAFILLIIFAIISPEHSKKNNEIVNTKQEYEHSGSSNKKMIKNEFSFNVEEFIVRYNESLISLTSKLQVANSKEKISNNTISVQLRTSTTKNIGLVVLANNTNRMLHSITFIGTGDGTLESGMNLLFGTSAVIMAIENPNMPVNERGKILDALGFTDKKLEKEEKITFVRKSVKYYISLSKEIGTVLTAEPVVTKD